MINVLVFPCGSEIGLEVNNALKFDKHINLFGLSSVDCHAKMVYKNYIEGISFITKPTFMDELNKIIDDYKIDVLIPAYDDVILYLADRADDLHCKLATSSMETCDICRSKIRTYEKLADLSFIPKMYKYEDIKEEDLPLFAKPDIGQGSQGILKVEKMDDLKKIESVKDDYVISEMLPGKEYTVDCYTDKSGKILITSMRERHRIRMGISVNTTAMDATDEVKEIAKMINERIKFNGVWFFQVKKDANDKFKLLEIAPRVAGSMSTSRVRGFNFILNTVYESMGYDISPIPNFVKEVEVDRAFSNKYNVKVDYDYVYIDFDDTITYKETVNTEVIAFIYQCLNKGKNIILLTRHDKEIYESLKKYHIAESIFTEIIHIKDDTNKSEYIKHKNAIFIDDSFRERKDVSEKCDIPVFDIDGVCALMDWRY